MCAPFKKQLPSIGKKTEENTLEKKSYFFFRNYFSGDETRCYTVRKKVMRKSYFGTADYDVRRRKKCYACRRCCCCLCHHPPHLPSSSGECDAVRYGGRVRSRRRQNIYRHNIIFCIFSFFDDMNIEEETTTNYKTIDGVKRDCVKKSSNV